VDPKDGSESFGVQKAQCEEIVRAAFGKGSIVVRPSYIVGPGDTSDRFPYWPQRLAKGGETLATALVSRTLSPKRIHCNGNIRRGGRPRQVPMSKLEGP
jgi:nucleoside-diphosphate-sugar epimerase